MFFCFFLVKICEDVVGDMEFRVEFKFLNEGGKKKIGIVVKLGEVI